MAKSSQPTLQLFALIISFTLLAACGGGAVVDSDSVADPPSGCRSCGGGNGRTRTATCPHPVVPPSLCRRPPSLTTSQRQPRAHTTRLRRAGRLYSLEDFGTDRNPLTGELMADSQRAGKTADCHQNLQQPGQLHPAAARHWPGRHRF